MDHYRIYLRAELGKLREIGDATAFLGKLPRDWLEAHGFAMDPDELTRQFAQQDAVDTFVTNLADADLVSLTTFCDKYWRRNGVSCKLTPNQQVQLIEAPLDRLLLASAECRLRDLFSRNHWFLLRIAQDAEILRSEPYCNSQPGQKVEFERCLAEPLDDKLRIFDGMHRAIQLVRNGAKTIPICVVIDENAA